MTRTETFVLVKNALANLARGSSAAVVAVVLPPFLARLMSTDAYGAWSLVLQISAYVGYLDFGLQTAVGRFVAHANEKADDGHRDRIVSTSLAALIAAAVCGIVAIIVGTAALPHIFRQMPANLLRETRLASVLVACSLAVGLPASVFNGIFVGFQRYEIPAVIIGGSRAFSAILLVLLVKRGGNLVSMAMVVAGINLASYCLQYLMYRKLVPMIRLSRHLVSLQTGRELFDYCLSLSVWTFAMVLITGLDILLVGYFQFGAVAYYAVAATLITFLAGIQNAIFTVLVPSTAVQHARGDSRELGRTIIAATRYGTFLLLLTGLPLLLATRAILTAWVGPGYALHGARVLQVLVTANMIRLSAIPYAMSLIGSGQHRLVTITPLLEGFTNLIVSVIGGFLFGAVGVAVGTLVGSLAGVAGNFAYNMRRTVGVEFRVSDYLRDGLLRPVICAIPLIMSATLLEWSVDSAPITRVAGFTVTLTATAFLVWNYGLVDPEREKLRFRRLASRA